MAKLEFRTCTKCKKKKSTKNFYAAPRCIKGVRPDCKDCIIKLQVKYAKKRFKKFPKIRKNTILKSVYGITIKEFEDMWLIQGKVCAICKKKTKKKCVDHCHRTKKFRGILCFSCNVAIVNFKENIKAINAAYWYVKRGGHV